MSRTPSPGRRAVAAVVLVVAGLMLCALYRLTAGTERHSFSPGAVPPSTVRLTEGRSYQLAVAGGVKTLKDQGQDVSSPSCSYTVPGQAPAELTVQAEGADTKATNTVATFVSPVTGVVSVDCQGWGPMFVDNADNRAPDVAGWFLVTAIVLLTVGLTLGLSALRSASGEVRVVDREDDRADDEVEPV